MRKFKKILAVVTVLMLVLTVLPTSVFAKGSYTAYASSSSIKVGKSTSLIISAKKAAGRFTVTSSNPAVASVNVSSTWVDGSTMDDNIVVKGVSAGTATITVTPENVSDDEYNLLTNTKSIKITVKKATTTPTTKPTEDKTEETKKTK